MNSSWGSQVVAILGKELRSESRSRHGVFTAGLFGFLTVIAMVFAAYADSPTPSMAAGMLTVALVFSSVVTMPRTMVSEDESGTFALLQLLAEPSAAYFGKLLSNLVQLIASTLLLSVVFVAMADVEVSRPLVFWASLLALPFALAGGATFCSALVMGAANRWLLAGAVSLPLLVPVVFLGVATLRCGLGAGSVQSGVESLVALAGYALVTFAAGPRLIAAVWRND